MRKTGISSVLLFFIFAGELFLLNGCKEDPISPTLTTNTVTNITRTTATSGGDISSNGGAEVTSRGVCWGTSTQPVVTGQHTSETGGEGSFASNITGLTAGTTYFVRAYAINKAGTSYGNELSFSTTPLSVAELTTAEVTGITSVSAVSGGNITSDGGADITARGICWSAAANPTLSDSKTSNGTGTGSFTANITGLAPGGTYHVRAYATNSVGTAYGNDREFKAAAITPTVTTAAISSYTRTTAVSGGNITSDGGAPVTARGVCWSTSPGPVATGSNTSDGTGTGAFTSNITGLSPNTTYYVRAYATNIAGTAYGNERSFTTQPVQTPSLTTATATNITLTTAVSGGNVTDDNGAPVTARGLCWNTTGNPTISDSRTTNGTGTGTFTSNLTGLSHGSVYYARAYATNSAGTGYGNQIVISTSVQDIDANIYRTVLIGTQLWMQSDLKTTRLNDNTSIPNITDPGEWSGATSLAYCWFGNNPSYGSTYGILYNWYPVESGKLCPTGWHVPTDGDFKILEMHLGMSQEDADNNGWRGTNQGTQLKFTSTWTPSTGTNTSGFAALGGGYRYGADGSFNDFGVVSYWWSSSLHWSDATKALYRRLDSNETKVYREGVIKAGGKYVRCLKN